MPDNVSITPGAGAKVASREVEWSGETAQMQVVALGTTKGDDDARTAREIGADNPLPTQEAGSVTSLLERILLVLLSPRGYDRATDRVRSSITIDASQNINNVAGVTTVTTVQSLSDITSLGTISARAASLAQINLAFKSLRDRIG